VEDLGAGTQRLAEGRQTRRDDHELLDLQAAVGVGAAVDDVHERGRKHARLGATEVAPERQPHALGRRARGRHRHAEDGVGAEPLLVLGPVEVDQRAVDLTLVGRLEAEERGRNLLAHVLDGLEHTLAEVALLVAVAQLVRLVLPRRRARGNRRAAECPVRQLDVDLERGIAAGVEDLSSKNTDDFGHSAGSL
jgi:hypothetical protein